MKKDFAMRKHIYLLDSLYSKSPTLYRILGYGDHFIVNYKQGDHKLTHPHNATTSASRWEYEIKELEKTWNAVIKKLYPTNMPENAELKPFWRAPFGEYDEKSLTVAAKNGYKHHFG